MVELKFDDVMEVVFVCRLLLLPNMFEISAIPRDSYDLQNSSSSKFPVDFRLVDLSENFEPAVAQGNQSCATGEAGTVPWWLRLVHGPTDISSGSQGLEVHGKFLRVSLFGTGLIFSCFMASSNATPLG